MGLNATDREFMASSFSGTLDEVLVFVQRQTATSDPFGGPIVTFATATSVMCNIQPIEAFRKIQEGLLVAAGGADVMSTHRGFIHSDIVISEGDRIQQASGAGTGIFDVKNVRQYTGSHIELDMLKVRPGQ